MENVRQTLFMQNCEFAEPASGTAIDVPHSGHFNFATGGSAETNTLPNPTRAGIEITLNCYLHGGGDRTITAAGAINQAGATAMVFGATRDSIQLVSIKTAADTYRWQVVTPNTTVGLS